MLFTSPNVEPGQPVRSSVEAGLPPANAGPRSGSHFCTQAGVERKKIFKNLCFEFLTFNAITVDMLNMLEMFQLAYLRLIRLTSTRLGGAPTGLVPMLGKSPSGARLLVFGWGAFKGVPK